MLPMAAVAVADAAVIRDCHRPPASVCGPVAITSPRRSGTDRQIEMKRPVEISPLNAPVELLKFFRKWRRNLTREK